MTTAIASNLPLFVLCGSIITTELATTTTTTTTVIVSIVALSLHLPLLQLGGLIMITSPTPTTATVATTTIIVETTTTLIQEYNKQYTHYYRVKYVGTRIDKERTHTVLTLDSWEPVSLPCTKCTRVDNECRRTVLLVLKPLVVD